MRTRELVVALALVFGCARKDSPVATAQQPSPVAPVVDVGAKAPDGQLTRPSGEKIALADVVHAHGQTVVVFYRGFW